MLLLMTLLFKKEDLLVIFSGMENIVIKRLLCTEPPCALDFKDYTELGLHLFFLHREDNKNVSGHPDPFKVGPIRRIFEIMQ